MTNEYSNDWIDIFLQHVPSEQTRLEIDFILSFMEDHHDAAVLDIACGLGRHVSALSANGYRVLGIDNNPEVIKQAKLLTPSAEFRILDMRKLNEIPETFDLVICLWQSFGYFEDGVNRSILKMVYSKIKPSGYFIVDIYHKKFFEKNTGKREFSRGGFEIIEKKNMSNSRLRVELAYNGVDTDIFDWQLYTPKEFISICTDIGFELILQCRHFDHDLKPNKQFPRVQYVFQRT